MAGPTAKRVAQETSEWGECAESSSLSSGVHIVSPECRAAEVVELGATAKAGERSVTEADGVAGLFGLVRLPLKGSSGDSTLSHIYERGAEDTEATPMTSQAPTGMLSMFLCLVLACGYDPSLCGAAVSDRADGHSDGGSASAGSKAVPLTSAASAVVGSTNLGPLCPTDFTVCLGVAGVFEEIARFGAPPVA